MLPQIELNWFEEVADVIEHHNDQRFLIGTVCLETLFTAIMGFTYYHHVTPLLEPNGTQSFNGYQTEVATHSQELDQIKQRITQLQTTHPEISARRLQLDNMEDPQFIDLAIPIRFTVPLPRQAPFDDHIRDRISPYIEMLGCLHDLELLKP
jgi:hypothetical protein